MKTIATIMTLFVGALLSGCNREHIDERLITSYSIETHTEVERDTVITEFERFLGDSGLKKAVVPGGDAAGFNVKGGRKELWTSDNPPFSITVEANPHPTYLSGDISWNYRGQKADWPKFEGNVKRFQTQLVEWFNKRPDVIHKESTFWDGSMAL